MLPPDGECIKIARAQYNSKIFSIFGGENGTKKALFCAKNKRK
jgi:hypothetical protein